MVFSRWRVRWRTTPVRARLWLGTSVVLLMIAMALIGTSRHWTAAFTALAVLSGGAALVAVVDARSTDVLEIKRLNSISARRADQVSVLSHEVRTPLAVIKGSADLLAEGTPGPLTERQRSFVRTIGQNADHVINLAENLLTSARIEAGLFDVHPELVNVRTVLRSAVLELRQVVDMPIVLDTPGAPMKIYAAPQLIKQAIVNLVTNAVRHAPGSERVTVRVARTEGDVMISISDDGKGIAGPERERLFQRFGSGAGVGDGTGLGLYITAQIIHLHGGRIHVDTIADRGTTMTFTLPAGGPDDTG